MKMNVKTLTSLLSNSALSNIEYGAGVTGVAFLSPLLDGCVSVNARLQKRGSHTESSEVKHLAHKLVIPFVPRLSESAGRDEVRFI